MCLEEKLVGIYKLLPPLLTRQMNQPTVAEYTQTIKKRITYVNRISGKRSR